MRRIGRPRAFDLDELQFGMDANMHVSATNILDVLDAAYQPHASEGEWLRSVGEAVHDAFDTGCGVHAYFVDLRDGFAARDPILVGSTAGWRASWRTQWWEPFTLSLE